MANDPKQVQAVFLEALEVPADQRTTFLDQQCGDDTDLRQRVVALLKAHADSGTFLDAPAAVLDLEAFVDTRFRQSDWPPPADRPPTRVGRYQVLERLGEGGMGTVYVAEQQEPVKRLVALKLIRADRDSRQVVARFEAERQALALMDHPNIAKVLDAGTTSPQRKQGMEDNLACAAGSEGRPYFVMELVQGAPITRYCDEARRSIRERLELFVPVCQAIQHAHQKGIIHRDVKPTNVLVSLHDGKPVPKVIDFGVAKAVGQKLTDVTLTTEVGQVLGTLGYMSPEQAEPNRDGVDTRADVYALGVLLYELLTGQTPLDEKLRGATLAEMLRLIREEEPAKPSRRLVESARGLPTLAMQRRTTPAQLIREVEGDLDWIVMKAMEKDRNRRYESASEFARDVERHLADEPVEAGPPSPRYRLEKFIRRNKRSVIAASLILGSLLLGVVGLTVGLVWAREAASKERAAKELAEGRLTQLDRANDILGSIFHDLDPLAPEKEGKSLNVILGERLDLATAQLDADAVGDPLAVARLQQALGSSQLGLGYFDKAIVLFDKARATRQALLGPDHPDTLTTKNSLAGAYQEAGKFPDALALFQETLDRRKETLGLEDPDTLTTMNNLGTVYVELGRLKEALPLFEKTLELREGVLGPKHRDTLESTSNLASTYRKLGRLKDALPLFEKARRLREETLGPRHPLTLRSTSTLASAYLEANRPADALPLCEKALPMMKERLGPRHRETLGAMGELAVTYRKLKRLDQAIPLAEETLKLRKEVLGPKHPDTLVSMNNLAVTYWEADRLSDALPLFVDTLKLTQERLPPKHPDTLRAMMNVASAYRKTGRPAEAAKMYDEALALLKEVLPPEHPLTLACTDYLAGAYLAAKQPEKALPLWAEFVGLQRKRLGADDLRLADVLSQVGVDLLRGEQHAEAERLLRESLAIREKKDADGWELFHAKSLLGECLSGQKKYADAEGQLVQGYEGMKRREGKIPGNARIRLTEAIRRLVRLYEAWEKAAEVSRWQKELQSLDGR